MRCTLLYLTQDVNDGLDAGPRGPTTSPHPPRLPLTMSMRPGKNLPPGTIWTGSGPGPDQSRRSLAVPVPVPEITSGTGLSGLWSSKNGPGPDQTELPQHYHQPMDVCRYLLGLPRGGVQIQQGCHSQQFVAKQDGDEGDPELKPLHCNPSKQS